ncbi:hypothetical protein H7H37_10700 [Mycolicibacterium insubricum]|nr:hypothetical protein [Mycolicibacterium insubricum]
MEPQCTTSDSAVTTPHSANSASSPAMAARTEVKTHAGRPAAVSARTPTREPTPMTAPAACTVSTRPKAGSAAGVCSAVITEDASWMTASATAAISSGPPSAQAITQRMTNHEALTGVAAAVVRAVPHTINAAGKSGMTPSIRPSMVIGTW